MRRIKFYLSHRVGRARRSLRLLTIVAALFLLFALATRPPSTATSAETVLIFASDCATARDSFFPGDTVCAVATGYPLPTSGFRQRRIQWLAPDGLIARQIDLATDPQSDQFTIPSSGTSAQAGMWSVRLINNKSTPVVAATFTVRDSANNSADLSVIKVGPDQAAAGSSVTYTVIVSNRGPDTAQNVRLTDTASATFVSVTQDSGPTFTCNATPELTACSIESLAAGQTSIFRFVYAVGGSDGGLVSSTASVSSSTAELNKLDNTSTAATTIKDSALDCTIICPGDVTAESTGCGAVVTYSDPSSTGDCGKVVCSPPSGSTFPNGATTVTCGGDGGSPCSFTVTVTGGDAAPPSISCPSDITTAESPAGSGVATVEFTAPQATDDCEIASVICEPPSGSQFEVGTTTVTCAARDESGNTASCSFIVTVTSNACMLECPGDISDTADSGQYSTVVNYPDPATSEGCGAVTCNPPSGSTFPLGITTVSCAATDRSGNKTSCAFKVAVSGTLIAAADSFITNGDENINEGANEELRIQSSGYGRALVRFDLSAISTSGLQSATLILNIAGNSEDWGSSGGLIDAHRLLADWTEGNGNGSGFRGTGEGVTWKCAKDADISNQKDDCRAVWRGGAFAEATAASVMHANGQTKEVSWNVTADVTAGANNGWLIKKSAERQAGHVRYYSREGAASAGNPNLAPRLALVY
ncbi:MAG: HYR domain-containing protein [Acidobacteriota bacterium]